MTTNSFSVAHTTAGARLDFNEDFRMDMDRLLASPAAYADGDVGSPRPYALGYTQTEFERLELQSGYYRDLSRDVFQRAGLENGMHVLDIGCGVGDVSMLAAELVGPDGSVLGVDQSPQTLNTARQRVLRAGLAGRVKFALGDLGEAADFGRFDAVIGRFILMYLPNPAVTIRHLANRCLKPGGILAFHEMSMHSSHASPNMPLFLRAVEWIIETFERAGFATDMGDELYRTFLDAGLPEPQMIGGGRVEGCGNSFAYDYIAATIRSLLPVMQKTGVATAEEVMIDDLADRLRAEAVVHQACIILPTLVGAWARMPE
jgi:ubiquinone/menaquinone biosynthesis C-methylase UbiE